MHRTLIALLTFALSFAAAGQTTITAPPLKGASWDKVNAWRLLVTAQGNQQEAKINPLMVTVGGHTGTLKAHAASLDAHNAAIQQLLSANLALTDTIRTMAERIAALEEQVRLLIAAGPAPPAPAPPGGPVIEKRVYWEGEGGGVRWVYAHDIDALPNNQYEGKFTQQDRFRARLESFGAGYTGIIIIDCEGIWQNATPEIITQWLEVFRVGREVQPLAKFTAYDTFVCHHPQSAYNTSIETMRVQAQAAKPILAECDLLLPSWYRGYRLGQPHTSDELDRAEGFKILTVTKEIAAELNKPVVLNLFHRIAGKDSDFPEYYMTLLTDAELHQMLDVAMLVGVDGLSLWYCWPDGENYHRDNFPNVAAEVPAGVTWERWRDEYVLPWARTLCGNRLLGRNDPLPVKPTAIVVQPPPSDPTALVESGPLFFGDGQTHIIANLHITAPLQVSGDTGLPDENWTFGIKLTKGSRLVATNCTIDSEGYGIYGDGGAHVDLTSCTINAQHHYSVRGSIAKYRDRNCTFRHEHSWRIYNCPDGESTGSKFIGGRMLLGGGSEREHESELPFMFTFRDATFTHTTTPDAMRVGAQSVVTFSGGRAQQPSRISSIEVGGKVILLESAPLLCGIDGATWAVAKPSHFKQPLQVEVRP